ncbi:MAG TPA: glycine zipper family protein [Aquabacterium sp.]|nr:glycine zipper family protein [Aquabacterium sp.]
MNVAFTTTTRPTMKTAGLCVALLLMLSACASSGPQSASAKPVLYPNDAFNKMGATAAQEKVDACQLKAQEAGISPKLDNNEVARSAGEGAAVGGAVGAVGGLLHGGISKAANNAAKGAVLGGTAGAVHGAFRGDKPNPTYRNFVGRCVKESGLEVIGWN